MNWGRFVEDWAYIIISALLVLLVIPILWKCIDDRRRKYYLKEDDGRLFRLRLVKVTLRRTKHFVIDHEVLNPSSSV